MNLQLVANSLERLDKLRSEVPMPKKISKKARALLGLDAAKDSDVEDGNENTNNTDEAVSVDPLLLEQEKKYLEMMALKYNLIKMR